jgi:hypothetical protein
MLGEPVAEVIWERAEVTGWLENGVQSESVSQIMPANDGYFPH